MTPLRRLFLILNLRTLVITAAAVLSTWACRRFGVYADFPITLITTAVVFPIVFSIDGAYKRREAALREYAALKTQCRNLYLATRDWVPRHAPESLERVSSLLGRYLAACHRALASPPEQVADLSEAVYALQSDLSLFIRGDLRSTGLAAGELSRANQYLALSSQAFENLRHIHQYRTPRTLRAFSDLFITILPPLYGPYFAFVSLEYAPSLHYVLPVVLSVILGSLDNIQEHLEHPFDGIGEDDLEFNAPRSFDGQTPAAPRMFASKDLGE
ncbi:MAG: hypothetical protein R3F17_17435 [Planctomycetota bacterium]